MTQKEHVGRSTWPTVQLSEVAEHCLGKMLDAQKNKGRPLPYLRNPNVRWFEIDTADLQSMPFEPHEDDRYGLQKGDVVVCEGGEAGRAAIWDGRLSNVKFQKAIHRVRPGPKLDARYLVYCLMTDHQNGRLADYYTGATIKHLTGQDLARYRFSLPPLPEQRRIAAILDKADALRAKRRAALAQLDTLTQSIFLDMFGDPATNRKGWPRATLNDAIFRATDGPHVSPAYTDTGVPFLSARHVRAGAIAWEDLKFISQGDAEIQWRKCKPEHGDILYTKGGTTGLAATVTISEPFAVWVHVALLKPNPAAVNPPWLESMLNSDYCYRQSQTLTRGIANRDLGLTRMINIEMFLPPLSLQNEFARRIAVVQGLRVTLGASLSDLNSLFASLQHRAFRGEL